MNQLKKNAVAFASNSGEIKERGRTRTCTFIMLLTSRAQIGTSDWTRTSKGVSSQRILSPLCLPFHHRGLFLVTNIFTIDNSKDEFIFTRRCICHNNDEWQIVLHKVFNALHQITHEHACITFNEKLVNACSIFEQLQCFNLVCIFLNDVKKTCAHVVVHGATRDLDLGNVHGLLG